MSNSITPEIVQRYQHCFESCRSRDWRRLKELEEILKAHPTLAQRRLTRDRLPLRVLLDSRGLPGTFQLLVDHGAEHDLLTAAASVDLEAAVRVIDVNPASVEETDNNGNTALHWACTAGYAKMPCDRVGLVNLLIAHRADVDTKNRFGESPLDCSILEEGGQPVEALLDSGAKPTTRLAVAMEAYDLLDELLCHDPREAEWISPRNGKSLLHVAVDYECGGEMIDYLLKNGAQPVLESRTQSPGWTPLLAALAGEAYDEAEALLRCGADATASEIRKGSVLQACNCLDYAIRKDRVLLAEQIITNGARLDASDSERRSLLFDTKSAEMAELLISRGANPCEQDERGRTPLSVAIEEGRRDVITALLRQGVAPSFYSHAVLGDLRAVAAMIDDAPSLVSAFFNFEGRTIDEPIELRKDEVELCCGSSNGTALHYAVKGGSHDMVRLFLDRGANVNAATPNGWTPLHDAAYYSIVNDLRDGHRIIRTLIDAGADLAARSIGGYRPQDVAHYLSTFSVGDGAANVFDLLATSRRV